MNNHTIIGAIKEKAGALEEGLGKVTGDTGTELRGQGRQIEGKVETMLGDVLAQMCKKYGSTADARNQVD